METIDLSKKPSINHQKESNKTSQRDSEKLSKPLKLKNDNNINKEQVKEKAERPVIVNPPVEKKIPVYKVKFENVKYIPPEYKAKPKTFSEIEPSGFTQEMIDIESIRGGILKTKSGRYFSIMEIFPVNFYHKSDAERLAIIQNYKSMFYSLGIRFQIKVTTELTNTDSFINHIKNSCPYTYGKRAQIRDEIISQISEMAYDYTISHHVYFIYPYEGNENGLLSRDFEEIYRTMMLTRISVSEILMSYGNIVSKPDNTNFATMEILYKLLNRGTYMKEPFIKRVLRINNDYKRYCEANNIDFDERKIPIADYISPRGMVIYNKEYIQSDAVYFTYMGIQDNGYPNELEVDWLNFIKQGYSDIDVDFYSKKLPHDATKKAISRRNAWNRASFHEINNEEKRANVANKISNSKYMLEHLENEDIYDCLTVLTLYNSNPKELIVQRDALKQLLKSKGFRFECSYNDLEEWYELTLPVCKFENNIFKRNKRNMLTSTLATTYCMTNYELSDPSGVVMGKNLETSTLFAFNPFSNMFANGNIIILGTSGSGKSNTEMYLGRHLFNQGTKSYFVMPVKGYEHLNACLDAEGTYIKLAPNNKNCLNFLEVFPEMSISEEYAANTTSSALNKKINSLCTWFKMLSNKEHSSQFIMSTMDMNNMNSLLSRMYDDYGITNDNDSVFDENSNKKLMPIFSTWQTYLKNDNRLEKYADLLDPFTKGTFKNFDGQTNIDLSNDYIVFDCDIEDIGEELHALISYIAFDTAGGLVRADKDNQGSIYVDEMWLYLQDEISAKQMEKNIRLIRGYGGHIISSSQQIREFADNPYGETIVSNSEIKIIMKLKDEEFDKVKSFCHIPESDRTRITTLRSGEAMFYCSNAKIKFKVELSEIEKALFSTSLKDKKKYEPILKERLGTYYN